MRQEKKGSRLTVRIYPDYCSKETPVTLFTTKHLLQSRRLYEGDIINLRIDELETADGLKTTREVIEHNGGVVIACQPREKEVVLIRQYRYAVDRELIELPAGRIEKNEPPLKAAQRELLEETGYQAVNWQEDSRIFSAPGFCNETLYFYRATDAKFIGKRLDEDEETEVLVCPFEQARQMVLTGAICDAKTIAGLALLMI
jgi:ADP-ribose pyrophosphatase